MNKLRKQTGISLVEIMVALIISLFLLGGIVQVYMGNKTTFRFTNALAEIQENGRFALDIMSQDLRLAHEWGCIDFPDNATIRSNLSGATVPGYTSATHDFHTQDAISGTNGAGTNPDTITIMGGKPGQTNIESPFSPEGASSVVTNAVNSISTDDIVLIMRCGAARQVGKPNGELMRVTNIVNISTDSQRQIFLSSPVFQQFENDATMIPLQTVTYSIQPGAGPGNPPSLWRAEFTNDQELVENVENLQVLYGLDTDADDYPNQYVTSDAVPDFDNVVSMRVMLLVRSEDFVTEDPQTYTFNGVTTTPADRRIRQVFTTTIALRNKIGG